MRVWSYHWLPTELRLLELLNTVLRSARPSAYGVNSPLLREAVSTRFGRQAIRAPFDPFIPLIAMPLLPLLTRLLLIASLILNGSGYALAADAGMAMQPHAHGSMAEEVVDVAAPPCHEAMAEADLGRAAVDADLIDPVEAADCCKAGSCLHTCHQQLAQAANTVAFLSAAILKGQDAARPLPSAHDAPALHQLIRPPIA